MPAPKDRQRSYTREQVVEFFTLYFRYGENAHRACTKLGIPFTTCKQWLSQERWADDLATTRETVSREVINKRNSLLPELRKTLSLMVRKLRAQVVQGRCKPSELSSAIKAINDAMKTLDSMARLDSGKPTSRSERADADTRKGIKELREEIAALKDDPEIAAMLADDKVGNLVRFPKGRKVKLRK